MALIWHCVCPCMNKHQVERLIDSIIALLNVFIGKVECSQPLQGYSFETDINHLVSRVTSMLYGNHASSLCR